MKLHLVAAILSCALLSLSHANIARTDQSSVEDAEGPRNVDQILATEKVISEVSPIDEELQESTPRPLVDIEIQETTPKPYYKGSEEDDSNESVDIQDTTPRPLLETSDHQHEVQDIQDTTPRPLLEADEYSGTSKVVPEVVTNSEITLETKPQKSTRVPKQLIGFIPRNVIRNAIWMAQPPQYKNVQVLTFDDENGDASNEIEEERALRRRKRFRKRNKNGHIKKSRRHKNTNKRNLKKRRKYNSKTKTELKRGTGQKKKKRKTRY